MLIDRNVKTAATVGFAMPEVTHVKFVNRAWAYYSNEKERRTSVNFSRIRIEHPELGSEGSVTETDVKQTVQQSVSSNYSECFLLSENPFDFHTLPTSHRVKNSFLGAKGGDAG